MSASDFDDDLDPIDRLASGLADSFAMVAMICGEGHSSFANLNDKLQDEYLFAVYNRIRSARMGFDLMMQERAAERAK